MKPPWREITLRCNQNAEVIKKCNVLCMYQSSAAMGSIFKMETQFNTGRAWFLSVALLLGTLGFVLVDHSSRTANLRGHLHAKHARASARADPRVNQSSRRLHAIDAMPVR